ncbi:MAG: hypothetical protein WDZ51_00455 [Pirellulaceae bacterium]
MGLLQAGPFSRPTDSLIAFPTGRHLAIQLDDHGAFVAGNKALLAPGQYLSGNLLSNQQQLRRTVYQRLLAERKDAKYPRKATLLAWTEPLETGFDLPSEAVRVGGALLAVPLRIDRPAAGITIQVPSPLIGYQAVGRETASTYDNDRQQWLGPFPENWSTHLRFQMPAEVLPLQVDKAVLSIQINAPARELQIAARHEEDWVSVATRQSPLGRLRFEIDRPELLRLDAQGGLLLGINITGSPNLHSSMVWKIEDVHLEVQGTTLEP